MANHLKTIEKRYVLFFVLDMKYQPFGNHAIEIKMRSLMFKSPPSTAKYDTTSLNEIEMTSTAMPRPKKIFLLNTSLYLHILIYTFF